VLMSCSTCRGQVELHELSQCSFCGSKNRLERQKYCLRTCGDCRTKDCKILGHSTCWEWHLPRDPAQHQSHVPLDPVPQLYVDAVTYMESKPEIQRKLHEEDRVARWFTIKSDNPATEAPRLCVTDRFRQLCSPGISDCEWSCKQYPGFVSFIGKTGIGKSTLLRAMILMGQIDPSGTAYRSSNSEEERRSKIDGLRNILAQKAHGPVTRSASLDNMTSPTSFGVHLYKDVVALERGQSTAKEITSYGAGPMLFIDCEGFQAGQGKANAQQVDSQSSKSIPYIASDLPITAESYSKSGKDGVDLFYARFIYAISDVVVFVMSGDTAFFPSMQRLVEWAEAAVRRSVNHLAQKTLVIVRNMEPLHNKDLYEPSLLKDKLLNNLQDLWEGSPTLTKFREDFNSKQQHTTSNKIFDNWDLLGKFFSAIEVCYIPDTARADTADDLFKQYRALRSVIVQASQESQRRRAKAWMQHNVPTLSHILNNAFEHFRTSDLPFDFYKAARNDNPTPTSVSDHVANFIRHVHLSESFSKSENFMANVIAICLVSRVLRTFIYDNFYILKYMTLIFASPGAS
jgi:energy-coupling factor transporter ATP-binding protein EcfA2